ncbi:MAG: sulfite reductase subunit alpha [Pseudomonadota bacterium]
MNMPFVPDGAPFSEAQRAWLAGFMAGLQSRAAAAEADGAVGAAAGQHAGAQLHILFGTQTGNAEAVAEDAAAAARQQGLAPAVTGLDEVSMEALSEMKSALIVISTYGEGEMPDNAELFWDALSSSTAPRLDQMKYSVLALGDTGYDEFCHAGKLLDTRLEQLGAERLSARVDCDVDFDEPAGEWIEAALLLAAEFVDKAGGSDQAADTAPAKPAKSVWNRKNPYPAPAVENRLLSAISSAKEIRHFALDLSGSDLTYEAGDALGVVPTNDPELVDALLARLEVDAEQPAGKLDMPLGEALRTHFEIMTPSRDMIREVAARADDDPLNYVLANGDKEALEAFMWGRDALDLLNLADKVSVSAEEFVSWLKPLQHRAYSISSSPKAHPGEVHLTVAAVRWRNFGRDHKGVCSTYLADRVSEDGEVPVFVLPNKSFRVPADDDAPVIMVGPGTGIAPFRAFLEERRERGAAGRNWLFFGDQHRALDFIYEEEISAMNEDGLLGRLDLAFSRDQKEKIYVQSRMHENARELFSWLEDGGHFYVCGDATRMARDVDTALHEIVASEGGYSDDDARDYISSLKREKRYLRDVY